MTLIGIETKLEPRENKMGGEREIQENNWKSTEKVRLISNRNADKF